MAVSFHRVRVCLHCVDDLLDEAFEEIELGGGRVAIDQAAGLDEGDRGQVSVRDVVVEVGGVLDVGRADGGVGHDGGVVLEGIADVAVLVGVRADGAVVELVRIGERSCSTGRRSISRKCFLRSERRRCCGTEDGGMVNDGVVGVGVGVGVVAVAEVSGVVVVQQVVVTCLAVRIDGRAAASR